MTGSGSRLSSRLAAFLGVEPGDLFVFGIVPLGLLALALLVTPGSRAVTAVLESPRRARRALNYRWAV